MKDRVLLLIFTLFCFFKDSISVIKTLDIPGITLPTIVETTSLDENTIASKIKICFTKSKSTNTEIISGIQIFTNSETRGDIETNLIGTCSEKIMTFTITKNKRILKVTFSSNNKDFTSGYSGLKFMLDDKSYSSWYGISTEFIYDLTIIGPIIGARAYIGEDYIAKLSIFITNSGYFYGQNNYYSTDYGSKLAVILAPSIVLGVVFLIGVGVLIYIWCSNRKSSNQNNDENTELNREINNKIKGGEYKDNNTNSNKDNSDNKISNTKDNKNDVTNIVIDQENDYNSNLNLNHNTNNFTDNNKNKRKIDSKDNNVNDTKDNKDQNNRNNKEKRIESDRTDFTIEKDKKKNDQKEILLTKNRNNNDNDNDKDKDKDDNNNKDVNENKGDNSNNKSIDKESNKNTYKDNNDIKDSINNNNNNNQIDDILNDNSNNNPDTQNVNVRNLKKEEKVEGNNKSLFY